MARFEIGSVVATPSVLALLAECGQSPMEFLTRHQSGDWGAMSEEDCKLNDQAIVGARIAEKAKAAGIDTVAFDRSGFRYHGRVKALAEAAREAGLKF